MHPLADPRAKLRWAKHHLAQLNAERDKWVNSHPYYVPSYPNRDKTRWKFAVHRFDDDIKPESEIFGLIVGDFVHSVRSALDQLVWQLVTVANGITPKRDGDVSFPIVTTHPKDFWSKPMIAQQELTFEQALFIEGFQPYRTIGSPERSPLAELNRLWNADKHKLITVMRVTLHKEGPIFEYVNTSLVEKEWDSNVALEGDTEIAWVTVKVTGPDPNVYVKWLPIDVSVGERERPIEDVQGLLYVAEQIVENSARFFEPSEPVADTH